MGTNLMGAAALAVLGAILCAILRQHGSAYTAILSITCGSLLILFAVRFLEPAADLLRQLQGFAGLDGGIYSILLRAAGLGLVTEFSAAVCEDAGEGALGKLSRVCGQMGQIYLAIPLLQQVLGLIRELAGKGGGV